MTKEKRKRSEHDNVGDEKRIKVTIKIDKSDDTSSNLGHGHGPILATFPCVQPPPDTKFTAYRRTSSNASKASRRIVRGSSDRMEYLADNFSHSDPHCRYLVGVYDRSTNTVNMKEAPLVHFNATAKALKKLKPHEPTDREQLYAARNALGETFGTKKAKAGIHSQQRNRIDSTTLEAVADTIQADIKEKTISMPSKEEVKADIEAERPIPPPNMEATTPAEAYNLHDIVSEVELSSIAITDIMEAREESQKLSYFPYKNSSWLNRHLLALFGKGNASNAPKKKIDKLTLRLLMYISYMMAFYENRKRAGNRGKTRALLGSPPQAILDQFYEKYTEKVASSKPSNQQDKSPGSGHRLVTDKSAIKLLSYMFLLCLRVDNYATDTNSLASDLALKLGNVNDIFKGLGCQVKPASATALAALNLKVSEAKALKIATLIVPLKFPEIRRRVMAQR